VLERDAVRHAVALPGTPRSDPLMRAVCGPPGPVRPQRSGLGR
jgi:hypothetical protein